MKHTSYDITEHEQSEKVLKRSLEQLASVSQASQAMIASLELDQVLAEIVSLASKVVASDYASVVLVDKDGKLSWSKNLPGVPTIECHIRAEGFTRWIVRSHQAVVVDDISEDGTVSLMPVSGVQSPEPVKGPCTANPFVVETGVKSLVGLPLVIRDSLLGVLYLYSLRPGNFRGQLPLLTVFANQVAIVIENARLYQAERKRAAQLSVLSQVSRQAVSGLDLAQFLQKIVTSSQEGFGYHNVALFLLDKVAGELKMLAIAGSFKDVVATDYRQAVGVGMIGWAAETGKPILANDVSQEPRYTPGFLGEALTGSELCIPLKLRGEIIGVLDVLSVELDAFNGDDVFILQTMADQLAVAIENARLCQSEWTKRHVADTLREVSSVLSSALSLYDVLHLILEQLENVVTYDTASVAILHGDALEISATRGYADTTLVMGVRLPLAESAILRQMMRGKEAIVIADVREDERWIRVPGAEHVRSWIGVPLLVKDKMVGALMMDKVKPNFYRPQDAQLVFAFANQAAVVIENARLYEAEAQRRQEAETLRQATMALTSTLNLKETLDHILEQLHGVVAYDSASVQLLRSDYLELVGGRGFADLSAVIGLRFPVPGDNPNARVIESGEPLVLSDAQAAHAPFREPPHDHIRSWLGVPMRFRERTIGVITLDSTELGHFTTDHARLATAFANQAAVAIENASLYEQIAGLAAEREGHIQERTSELIRKASDLSFLYQTSVDLSSSLDKDEVLNILARQAALAMNAVDCIIYELQDDVLAIVAHHRDPTLSQEDSIGQRYLLADFPATKEAIEKGQPLWVNADDPLADEAERAELQRLGYASLLQVHIVSGDQVLGVVEVLDDKSERQFGEDDAALLQTVANQAGMAIEKAHLFQQVREESNRLALLYDVSRKLSASLDPEQTLRDVFQVSISATGASRGSVFIFDDEGRVSYRILMRDLSPPEADDVIDLIMRKGLASWVLRHKQPAIVFDVSQDERWFPIPNDPEPVGSAMAIPFIERNRVRGLLTLVHPQPYHFNQVHLDLLLSIANQVAGVIERARLYDETQRRAMEVAAQKEQTDAIMQSMADGLIVTDLENKIVLANPAAEELLQFKLEDAIGQDIGVSIRDDRLRHIVHVTLDRQQADHEVDIEMTDPQDGTQRVMRAHTAVVNDPSGQLMGIVITLRDVTHEREVQRLKDELISTVSHELRTPLTSVLGFSELLLNRQLSDEQQQLYLQTIHKEAQRLSALINDFLDIQRMERGQQEYHFEEVDLSELAHEMAATYRGQSEAHTLSLDLPPELPPVRADSDRLRQVLGNLLSNAIKFSPDGGMVTISVQVLDDAIQVAVSDNGIGIPAEAQPRIFEKFFRVDSSDRREIKGTGLGLAISKEIVKAHEGNIWAESQLGTGTTVTFSLPMITGERILVLDDEKDIREMFQRLLGDDYIVLTAANGQEGLSLMEEELPDLVILDIAMPVMNGYQFLEEVKGNQRMKDIPVIAISGVDTDINRLEELGAEEFLSKPFSGTVLLETVHRLLKRS